MKPLLTASTTTTTTTNNITYNARDADLHVLVAIKTHTGNVLLYRLTCLLEASKRGEYYNSSAKDCILTRCPQRLWRWEIFGTEDIGYAHAHQKGLNPPPLLPLVCPRCGFSLTPVLLISGSTTALMFRTSLSCAVLNCGVQHQPSAVWVSGHHSKVDRWRLNWCVFWRPGERAVAMLCDV